jgi:hypothetical protein
MPSGCQNERPITDRNEKMSEAKKYFSYHPEWGFELYSTAEEAKEAAEKYLDADREQAWDGWPEGIEHICWGELKQHIVETINRPRSGDDLLGSPEFDAVVDYDLADIEAELVEALPEPVAFSVYADDEEFIYISKYKWACHDHINDAIDRGIDEAANWRVVSLYAEPPARKALEAINAELVEALTKIVKTCDPNMSHQEAFIVKTINEALVKAQTLRDDLIVTQFKAGDCIPEWVLKAPKKELQGQATFAVDVEVYHSHLYVGPVRVFALKEFDSDDIFSMVRIPDTEKGVWTGAPTDWNSKPFNCNKEQ